MSKKTKIIILVIAIGVVAYGIFKLGWFGLVKPSVSSVRKRAGDPCITSGGASGVWVTYTSPSGITYAGCAGLQSN